MNNTILVDMDMVLADFESHRERILRERFPDMNVIPAQELTQDFYGAQCYPEGPDRDRAKAVILEPGFCLGIPVMPGAQEALRWSVGQGHKIEICTAPMSHYPTCEQEKREWAERHFPFVKVVHVTKNKHLVPGRWLVDDHPNPLKKAGGGDATASWTHILFSSPANMTLVHPLRLNHWSEWPSLSARILEV